MESNNITNKKAIKTVFYLWLLAFFSLSPTSFVFSKEGKENSKSKNPTISVQQSKIKKATLQPKRNTILGTPKVEKAPEKEISVIMNDPLMKKKWDLEKTNVKKAWLKFSKGSRDIIVAVIDTGIHVNHPDLKANIWKNPKEIPGNNKDDDGNCYIDDIHGWNFVSNSKKQIRKSKECKEKTGNNKVYDTHGHGTHIAGIIGAVGGNGIGLSGVAPKVSLMALKYYTPNDDGKKNLKNTIKAIQYAIKNGAHIINYSGGGLEGNSEEKKVIKEAEKKGILFVAAAGNEGSNTDKKNKGYYPANYPLSNILPVTATDLHDQVLSSSNWGKKTVHKSAPGWKILSTLPGGKYGQMTGTSQATAVATGAAVLIMDYYKNKTARFAIKHLKMTGDIKESLVGKTSQRRQLNIFKALQARGITLNFMDEKVDTTGKIFPVEEEIPSFVEEPLKRELAEIEMVQDILNNEKKDPNEQEVEEKVLPQKRDPSSFERKRKTPFLKRWFFNKK